MDQKEIAIGDYVYMVHQNNAIGEVINIDDKNVSVVSSVYGYQILFLRKWWTTELKIIDLPLDQIKKLVIKEKLKK